MEVKQKIETRILRTQDGGRLILEYCLLACLEEVTRQTLRGPYGMEIILRSPAGERREVCRRLTENYKQALELIHMFAAHCVMPAAAPSRERAG